MGMGISCLDGGSKYTVFMFDAEENEGILGGGNRALRTSWWWHFGRFVVIIILCKEDCIVLARLL